MAGETADVHFVDHQVVLVKRRPLVTPVKFRMLLDEHTQWRPAHIRARALGGLAIKCRGEKDLLRVGIQQQLVRIEGVQIVAAAAARAIDAVGVVARAAQVLLRQATMPDAPGLVDPVIEIHPEHRGACIVRGE